MKKKTILLIIFILAISYYYKFSTQSTKANPPTLTNQTQSINYQEFQKRQNPQIIENELKQVGKLTVLEGQYNYIDSPTEKAIFDITLRQINIDFTYRFGLGIDLEDVKVVQIVNSKIVYIRIPHDKLQLQFIELIPEKSTITNGKKFFLASQFKPSETDIIINQCQQNVVNKIGANQKYFDAAMDDLKSELDKFILNLGYTQVIYV